MFSIVRSLQPKGAGVHFIVLDCGISRKGIDHLLGVTRSWDGRASVELQLLPPGALDDAPVHHHFSAAACARLLLPELRPDLDRVLYIDSDTVVRDDLRPLAMMRLGANEVGAAAGDFAFPTVAEGLPAGTWESGREAGQRYFNSGVLLMECRRWRQEQLGPKMLRYLAEHATTNRLADQDAINGVIGQRLHVLPPRMNYQVYGVAQRFALRVAPDARRAAVLHFVGGKPWQADGLTRNPTSVWARRQWYQALDESGALTWRHRQRMRASSLGAQVRRLRARSSV